MYKFSDDQLVCVHEKRVIRQFIEALLYEGIVDYQYNRGVFTFALGEQNYQAYGSIGGYSRIHLDAGSIVNFPALNSPMDDSVQQIKSPLQLETIVDTLPASDTVKQQLLIELNQTIQLCRTNAENLPTRVDRRSLSYAELEAAIDEGHPYHPCFKARSGFNEADHRAFGPEFENEFQLHWLAIHQSCLKMRLCAEDDLNPPLFWQAELGRFTYDALMQTLTNLTETPESYALMPVHPWQWAQIASQLTSAITNREVFPLGPAGDSYRASISVRTLLNVSDPEKANIKLPMNMVNSSSLRTLPDHSIYAAPLLSQWLNTLVDDDEFYAKHRPLGLLDEYAGISLNSDNVDDSHWTKQLSGQLGVIFRQSVDGKYPHQTALPFVALALEEADNLPFIHPWIQQYGCQQWLTQLVDVVVAPLMHLMLHHGIALEAHAQNMILIHDDGWPLEIIVRDFHESLEYVESYIAAPDLIPDFNSLSPCYINAPDDQYFWMSDVEALRELIVDTLFVYNFAEIARLLDVHYDFSQALFWQTVNDQLHSYISQSHTDTARIRAIDLHQPRIQTESLMRKKLSGLADAEFHHQIVNALAESQPLLKTKAKPKTKLRTESMTASA
ncbi:Aerobactin synthase [BD1-7 clade bacterium]|nr:Aerobactin synthase [BD1-7 clade bacterium]